MQIQELETAIAAAGHKVRRTYEGAVSEYRPEDPGWIVEVDGVRVATGASLGDLEASLTRWWRLKNEAPAG